MPKSRARIVDNDPLTPTDKVLDKLGQVNQPTSQEVEKSASPVIETTSIEPAVNKSNSQEVNNQTSSKSSKSASQPAKKPASSTTKKANQSDGQQSNKSTSQLPKEASKSASSQSDKLTTDKVKQPASQKPDSSTPPPATKEVDRSTSQPVKPQPPRKATFQIEGGVLDNLERYHLQLLIELGKRNAPYKETIVEEAIAQWLERAAKSPERSIKSLLDRQQQR